MLAIDNLMAGKRRWEGTVLELERAELLIYDLPHDLVGGHGRGEVSIGNCRGTNL